MYVILVLHLISILISENIFLWHLLLLTPYSRPWLKSSLLSLSIAKTAATVLITSRFDYCNSLLYNIELKDIAKLQCVQKCLARVVTRAPRFSNFVPLLKYLHWFPVQARIIICKLCTIVYRTFPSGEPSYLFSMLFNCWPDSDRFIPPTFAYVSAALDHLLNNLAFNHG